MIASLAVRLLLDQGPNLLTTTVYRSRSGILAFALRGAAEAEIVPPPLTPVGNFRGRQGKHPIPDPFWRLIKMTGDRMFARREIFIGLGLFLLTISVYYPALEASMVADDFRIVERLNFDDAFRSLHETVGYGRNEYRPLIAFSYALSNTLWRGDPRGYHLESILLHALNVLLLFSWLFLLTRSSLISSAAGLMFAIHPIHHSRVVWIAARDSLPSLFFLLAALIAYTLARRPNDHLCARKPGTARVLVILSIVFFALSLLCYEGAVVLPGILFGLEFLLLARPAQAFWSRVRTAAVRVLPHAAALGIYLAFWLLLFRGEVGQYDLSLTFGNFVGNYHNLLYQLLHGHQRLAGILYFFLFILGLLLPRGCRPLLWFSILFMLAAFVPFVMITGFAARFAYASAIGYALLAALLLSAGFLRAKADSSRTIRILAPSLAAMVLLLLAGYYVTDLRARIAEWKAAGEIADSIPRQIKARYPDLPTGSTLVLARIPRMHGHAYLYPLGLKASIERFYSGRDLQVYYGPGEVDEILQGRKMGTPDTYLFRYIQDRQGIEEITIPHK